MWYRKGLSAVAVLVILAAATTEAWALPAPTDLLAGIGVDPWRDLDGQTPTDPGVCFATEDRVRRRDGRVGPGVGGQKYDWEGLYSWRTDTHIYVVLATGFRILPGNISRAAAAPSSPDSAAAGIDFTDGGHPAAYAGDILVDTGQDGVWDYGITLGAYPGADGRAGLVYGDLFLIDTTGGYAGTGTYRPGYKSSSPWLGTVDTILASLDYSAERIWVKEQAGEDMNGTSRRRARFLAAFEIDLSLFPDFREALAWHWTMECGNDVGELACPAGPPPSPPPVPEPVTLVLMGSGMLGVGLAARRRGRTQNT